MNSNVPPFSLMKKVEPKNQDLRFFWVRRFLYIFDSFSILTLFFAFYISVLSVILRLHLKQQNSVRFENLKIQGHYYSLTIFFSRSFY